MTNEYACKCLTVRRNPSPVQTARFSTYYGFIRNRWKIFINGVFVSPIQAQICIRMENQLRIDY